MLVRALFVTGDDIQKGHKLLRFGVVGRDGKRLSVVVKRLLIITRRKEREVGQLVMHSGMLLVQSLSLLRQVGRPGPSFFVGHKPSRGHKSVAIG